MRGTKGIALAAGLVAALLVPASASAYHQPGDVSSKVFKATIDATGIFSATGTSQGGGEWVMSANPFWKVVYPDLAVPMSADVAFRPAADYSFSGSTASTVTWNGTAQYDFETPGPEAFSCTAALMGPVTAGPPQGFFNRVEGQDGDVKFELSALNQFGLAGSYGCNPLASTGFAPWAVTLGNNTQVFTTIPRAELFDDDSVQREVSFGSSNALPQCTYGCSNAALQWQGTLKLEKNCRNYAGTAKTFGSGPTQITNPFCESECSPETCYQADLDLIPLTKAVKEDGGDVEFTVGCYGEADCTGTHLLQAAAGARRAGTRLGSGTFAVEPAAHSATTVKLARAGKRLLRREGKIKATLKSELEGEEVAEPATDALKVTIKPG